MTHPRHNIRHAVSLCARRDCGTVDHDDRQAKSACRLDFGIGTRAACILGHNQIDAMRFHQCAIIGQRERATRHQHVMIWKRRRIAGRIDQPQQIEMLRIGRERVQMHAPNSQHHARRRTIKGTNRPFDVGHMDPVIAGLRAPRRAGQRDQGDVCMRTGRNGIAAHLRRKRMGGVHDMGHTVAHDIVAQTVDPAKPANALGQWLAPGALYTACETDDTCQSSRSHRAAQRCGLGRAPKDQKVDLHV